MNEEALKAARDAAGINTRKSFKDVFIGEATITKVEARTPRWTDGLSEEDISNSFDIEITVMPACNGIGDQIINLPVSPRSRILKNGDVITDTASTVRELTSQKLIEHGDISLVFDKVGSKVTINCYDETSAKGTFHRCRFTTAKPKLSQAEILKRIVAMTGKTKVVDIKPDEGKDTKPNPFF